MPTRTASVPEADAGASKAEPTAPSRRPRQGNLLPRIARELKAPLRSIRAASHAVRRGRDGSLSRKQERMLRIITEESAALVCLIEDLLDMAEIESGRIALRFQSCCLLDVARASLDRQRPRYRQKGVDLVDSLPAICPDVRADAARLRQVFDHLLSSALKFTPRGRRVEVRFGRELQSSRSSATPMLRIGIADTGERIAREDLGSLFEAGRGAAPRAGGANGLGLSLVRFLVEAHGGEIWAESGQSRENVMLFTLPTIR